MTQLAAELMLTPPPPAGGGRERWGKGGSCIIDRLSPATLGAKQASEAGVALFQI